MKRLNYNVLQLKDMAIRKLVSVLFKEPDILSSVSHFKSFNPSRNSEDLAHWQETVEDKMLDSIIKLGLSSSLKKLLIDTVKPMGRQIPHWKAIHFRLLIGWKYDDESSYERLCWTSAGALDYRKTARELIRSNDIDNVIRYQLASLYCLEDFISQFWKDLSEEMKMYFYDEEDLGEFRIQRLEFCWPYIMRGEQSKLDSLTGSYRRDSISFYQFAFQESAMTTNKAAVEYFFQKLTQEEKEASLIKTTQNLLLSRKPMIYMVYGKYDPDYPKEKCSETFRYLLSLMTPGQQMQVFQEHGSSVLKCFVDWPLQDQFSEIADLIWNFLPEWDDVGTTFDTLLCEIYLSWKNSVHYIQALLQDLFSRIPAHLRKSFVGNSLVFMYILREQDREALQAIFRAIDSSAREALVSGGVFLKHIVSSISPGQWDVVEMCLREAKLSETGRERVKAAFLKHLTSWHGIKRVQFGEWARFFQLLAETDVPAMRCSEDESSPSESKKKKSQL